MTETSTHTETELLQASALIDPIHYGQQAGQSFSDAQDAYAHYRATGQTSGLNPSPYFYSEWYAWQNPDAPRDFPSLLDHFASKAAEAPVDPAPFLDSVDFLARHPQFANMAEGLAALVEGRVTSVSPRLEDHLEAQKAAQKTVHDAIRSAYIKKEPTKRKRLVWVQAGPGCKTLDWFEPEAARSWDLMFNWYSLNALDLRHGEIHLRQSGTKSTAIHHVLQNDPELLRRYDQILFLDDDLTLSHADIDVLFQQAKRDRFDFFQPSLLHGSFCVWPDLFQTQSSNKKSRQTSGIEIMMPGFTTKALFEAAPYFGQSVSGYGLDFLVAERLREKGYRCGVIHKVGVGHFSKIDAQDGAYYRLMRSLGIQPKLELYSVIREIGDIPRFKKL